MFVMQIEINDNDFRSICLVSQMVGLRQDSFRSPFCHVGGREFASRASHRLASGPPSERAAVFSFHQGREAAMGRFGLRDEVVSFIVDAARQSGLK